MSKTKSSRKSRQGYVICVERGTYRVDLQVGKVYCLAAPEKNDPASMVRVIDDSGEDYLYPTGWFVPVDLPSKARKALAAAS